MKQYEVEDKLGNIHKVDIEYKSIGYMQHEAIIRNQFIVKSMNKYYNFNDAVARFQQEGCSEEQFINATLSNIQHAINETI